MSIKISTLSMNAMNLNTSRNLVEKYADSSRRVSELNDESNIQVISYGAKLKDQLLKRRDLFFSEAFISRNNTIRNDLDIMLVSVEGIIDEVSKFRDSLIPIMNGNNNIDDINTLKENAKNIISMMISSLNIKSGDRYLFGGEKYNTPPVARSVDDFFNGDYGVENFDYYVGGSSEVRFYISDDREIGYKINAGDSAFEKAFRGLDIFINNERTSDEELFSVQNILNESLDELLSLKSYIGVNDAEIKNTNEFLLMVQENSKSFLTYEYNAAEQAANLVDTQSLLDKLQISVEMNNMLRKAIEKMVG